MSARARHLLLAVALCLCAAAAPAAARAEALPAWRLTLTPIPSNVPAGGEGQYYAVATNVGGASTADAAELEMTLPAGLTPTGYEAINSDPAAAKPTCEVLGQEVLCEAPRPLGAGRLFLVSVEFDVSAPEGSYEATATVGGGGAADTQSATAPIAVQPDPLPFEVLPGFAAPASEADGAPSSLAAAHPYQQTIDFGFPTEQLGNFPTGAGHPRDITLELPRGLLGDPAATAALCTEAQLLASSCPKDSEIGLAGVTTLLFGELPTVFTDPLYNMVPPPGYPAEIATNVAHAGIYAHVLAEVRSEGDYGVRARIRDALALPGYPIFNVQSQLWGDPGGAAHDQIRAECLTEDKSPGGCPAPDGASPRPAFLTMPGDCRAAALPFEVRADSWEEPDVERKAGYESADLSGQDPVHLSGCGEVGFAPTIEVKPSADAADSPSGLDVDLRLPPGAPSLEPLAGRATAILKDATLSLPAGVTVNPSQAAGLEACTEAQIGFAEEVSSGEEAGALRFTKAPQSCPEASKVGTLEATSPLLVQRNAEHEVQADGEGAPLPEALHGSLYLAKPYANPFGSLLALYLAVEDPKTGIVAKLAGEGSLDPDSGQITTRFAHNPEIPLTDIHVHVFGGERGALITPGACGSYSTSAELVPWSAPEGPSANPTDSFAVSKAPDGGPCPPAPSWAPALSAGTLAPAAGRYSPLAFKLTRPDGSERLSSLRASLPAGLTARLAGVGRCSEAEIAKARSREAPNKGAEEIADPGCPASSRVGSVDVASGAGPAPFHVAGSAYLAGPYKGAPLSMVIITPAVAGPFDLGAVVVRAAVHLDPVTARPSAVSDPVPQFIQGVPADVRSVTLELDRPSFTLNPTSCEEEAFEGDATSALGHVAPLFERFQVGGCASLPYAPKLATRLYGKTHRGAHPRLRSVFTARPGEADTARISFALPHSEFIDQSHFRTICTRVQFAAHACPKGSVYGHMKVITPLIEGPLQGPIYLRSSSHELPDVVAALHGPPDTPVELELAGRVDSVHGGVRTIFANVPDAPVTKAIVTLQGKRKGLFQNSTDICKGKHRATLKLTGQNGKAHDTRPLLRASCHRKAKRHKRRHRGRRPRHS